MLFNKGDLLFRLSQPYPHLLWLIIPLLCRVLWTHLMNRSQKALPGSQTISFQQSPKRCAASRNILQFPGWTQHLRADDKIDPNIKLHCVAIVLSWSVHVIKSENGLGWKGPFKGHGMQRMGWESTEWQWALQQRGPATTQQTDGARNLHNSSQLRISLWLTKRIDTSHALQQRDKLLAPLFWQRRECLPAAAGWQGAMWPRVT